MSEWVVESDWSKVAVGDRVRVTNLDGADLEFVVKMCADPDYCGDRWVRSSNTRYVCVDWTLYVASKPTPALPTEPGVYADSEGDPWGLDRAGRWKNLASYGDYNSPLADDNARLYAPFTRLESQADTARKVLEALRQNYMREFISNDDWSAVAAEFGVSL